MKKAKVIIHERKKVNGTHINYLHPLPLPLLPALFGLTGDFFLLGETSKSSNACGHFEGDGLDGLILGFGRIGIGRMSG